MIGYLLAAVLTALWMRDKLGFPIEGPMIFWSALWPLFWPLAGWNFITK